MALRTRFAQAVAVLIAASFGTTLVSCTGTPASTGDTATLPSVTTLPVYLDAEGAQSAHGGGSVSADGGLKVTVRGVCWGTVANPTVDDDCTTDGRDGGEFTSATPVLLPETTYHVRAYATNYIGTAYGEDATFITGTAEPVDGGGNDVVVASGARDVTVVFGCKDKRIASEVLVVTDRRQRVDVRARLHGEMQADSSAPRYRCPFHYLERPMPLAEYAFGPPSYREYLINPNPIVVGAAGDFDLWVSSREYDVACGQVRGYKVSTPSSVSTPFYSPATGKVLVNGSIVRTDPFAKGEVLGSVVGDASAPVTIQACDVRRGWAVPEYVTVSEIDMKSW